MTSQRGVTLTELLTVVAVASMMLLATVSVSLPWLARETMRGAQHDVQAFLQLTKIEAASRNHLCRFVLDGTTGSLAVWDTLGTAPTADDLLLHQGRIHDSVGFARPDGGSAVTLAPIGESWQSVYEVCLHGGTDYGRISVYAAGGVELSQWDGTAWRVGA